MTYCDKDCQREHWLKVHRNHCKFLSGQKPVANSNHVPESCSLCQDQKNAGGAKLFSWDSPETNCHVEVALKLNMKNMLANGFGFHEEGRSCKCSPSYPNPLNQSYSDFACELPFALGEVSGAYIGAGQDEMLAHALKILNAMRIKSERDPGQHEKIVALFRAIIFLRSQIWMDLLVYGAVEVTEKVVMYHEKIEAARDEYGDSSVWWNLFFFTFDIFDIMTNAVGNKITTSEFTASDSLADTRFTNFKRAQLYFKKQLEQMAFLSENNLWNRFKLWPTVIRNKLEILLPPRTFCVGCEAPLSGAVSFDLPEEVHLRPTCPILTNRMGKMGRLAACCPKPACFNEIYLDDVFFRFKMEELEEKYKEEVMLFTTTSRGCDTCLKMSVHSHRCSSCYAAQYCSTSCQGKDLSFHKTVCKAWANDKSRQIIGGREQKKIITARLKNAQWLFDNFYTN